MTVSTPVETAVLFLVFNRPAVTAQVFEAIRRVRPARLYVAADGPRAERSGEAERCDEVRRIATAVDWPCEVKTLFRDGNLGCRRAVSGAIDWFFENEEQGVILEDDCVPDPSYFRFASELLERYKDDERVMSIGAVHFPGAAHQPPYSYFFSRNQHCWGWASWRRAWKLYDSEMSQWPALRGSDWLLELGDGNRLFQKYWADIFDRAHAGQIDSWAYRWTFSCWAHNALSILPAKNLVRNIGFEEDATHTAGSSQWELALEPLQFPLAHPPNIERDIEADAWSDRNLFAINRMRFFKESVRKFIRACVPLALRRKQ